MGSRGGGLAKRVSLPGHLSGRVSVALYEGHYSALSKGCLPEVLCYDSLATYRMRSALSSITAPGVLYTTTSSISSGVSTGHQLICSYSTDVLRSKTHEHDAR